MLLEALLEAKAGAAHQKWPILASCNSAGRPSLMVKTGQRWWLKGPVRGGYYGGGASKWLWLGGMADSGTCRAAQQPSHALKVLLVHVTHGTL